jgi:hypothetical protein
MKSPSLTTFYDPRMSLDQEFLKGYTLTPAKPRLIMENFHAKFHKPMCHTASRRHNLTT